MVEVCLLPWHLVFLSVYPFVYTTLSISLSTSLSILRCVSTSIPLCASLSVPLSTSLSIPLCATLSILVFVFTSIFVFVYVYPSLCLSIPTFAFLPMRRCAILFILLCVSMSSNLESYSVYPSLCFHVCVGLSLCLSAYPSLCRNIRLFSIWSPSMTRRFLVSSPVCYWQDQIRSN